MVTAVQMAGEKNDVWKYFTIRSNEDTKATCTFCQAKISCGSANMQGFTTRDMKIINLQKEPHMLRLVYLAPVHIQITELIGKMICCDMLPFRIIESEGFNDLISFLEPRYKIPDQTTFSRTVIAELYQRVQSRVKEGFVGVEHVSLTSDLWSTHACDDFISLTAHFVDNNFEH
ncbi:hypothetical protein PR048_008888 [Dryococelus australis]|uniref:BED-type domain-containing protein n=1 Tax=Dryococelus australis TaxID=614101 RepID=A0ABQ9HZ99_9NEOP|nr:hypothetical protein PR048_008888 [Dryococelus australis]